MCSYCDEHELPHYGKWPEENGHKLPRGELPLNFVPDSALTGTYYCPACFAGRECMQPLEVFKSQNSATVFDAQGNRIIVLSRLVGRPAFLDPNFIGYLSHAQVNFTGKESDHWLIIFPIGMNHRILSALMQYGYLMQDPNSWSTLLLSEERVLTTYANGFRFVIFEENMLADFQNPPSLKPVETSQLH